MNGQHGLRLVMEAYRGHNYQRAIELCEAWRFAHPMVVQCWKDAEAEVQQTASRDA